MSAVLSRLKKMDKSSRSREMLSICLLLLSAGNITATDMIGNGVLALLNSPNELAKLVDRPNYLVMQLKRCYATIRQLWTGGP